MTINEMHTGVRMEIDKSGTLDSVGFETIEIDYWLNTAITSLVKTKYSGSISTRGAFEQNQKRIDDLRTLVVETSLTTATGAHKPYSFTAALPSSGPDDIYWFALGEEVDIAIPISTSTLTSTDALVIGRDYYVVAQAVHGDPAVTYPIGAYFRAENTVLNSGTVRLCTTVRQGTTQVTADTYRAQIDNPYSEHILDNNEAKPLRLFIGDLVEFITDGNYGVIRYHLRYLKRATKVNILTTTVTTGSIQAFITYLVTGGAGITYNGVTYNPAETFVGVVGVTTFAQVGAASTVTMYPTSSDLPEHTHDEIVKAAATMIIENIESPRYRTHSYEARKTE